jgi:tungstate transport system substrate-binding protein
MKNIGLLPLFIVAAAACVGTDTRDIVLATTTSVEDSGLLDALMPAFEAAHPRYRVWATAVGSGQAFELGRRGDADVLITHAPAQEAEFVSAGHGAAAHPIMHNRFVIVGPASDPAAIRDAATAQEAFRRIAAAGAPFVSRGDDSGTHVRERGIWDATGLTPDSAAWYTEAGLGMGDVLRLAGERGSYTLSDRASFVVAGRNTGLALLLDAPNDASLHNPYSVIAVANAPNQEGARLFVDWIRGDAGQALIATYRADDDGVGLFVPATAIDARR